MEIDNKKAELGKKILILLICFYISIDLASDVLASRLVPLGHNHLMINASAFCYPVTYLISDTITELFGFSYGRLTIWIEIIVDWVFVWLIIGLISLPLPENSSIAVHFHAVLYPMSRVAISEVPALIIGRFINIYFLAKSKILLNSRFFLIRSMASSCLGAVTRTIIVNYFIFSGVLGYSAIASIVFIRSLFDIFTIVFLSWIPFLVVYFVRNKLGIDEFNYKEKFNPFKRRFQCLSATGLSLSAQ